MISTTCHTDRKHYALGLCRSCYERKRLAASPELREKHRAYRASRPQATCHPQRKERSAGLCGACYEFCRREANPKLRVKAVKDSANWQARHPDRMRVHRDKAVAKRRLATSGVTPEMYALTLAKQGGRCAICPSDNPGKGRRSFCADHDHKTGKFRGLLCAACNVALGYMRDDPSRLRAAAAYLEDA